MPPRPPAAMVARPLSLVPMSTPTMMPTTMQIIFEAQNISAES